MATIFQLLSDDETTVLFDFIDETGASNPEGLQSRLRLDPNFSAPAGEHTLFEPPDKPGGSLTFTRDELVESSWRLHVTGATTDALARGVGEMARLLRAGKVLKWQSDGATEPRFIDYEAVSVGALARGQNQKTIAVNHTDAEFPIAIVRQPFMRGPELDSDTNIARNSLLIHEGATAGRPRDWDWDVITDIANESIDAATESYTFDIATAAVRQLQQRTAAGTAAEGEVWTFGFYGFVNAGTDVRARARIEFEDAANTVLATHDGTLTTLGTARPNLSNPTDSISVTTTAAPVNTDHIKVSIRFENATATQRTVRLIGAQLELSSTVTRFVVATETQTNEVEETTAGYPSVAPFYIHGDVPTPVEFVLESQGHGNQFLGLRSAPEIGEKRLSDYLKTTHFAQAEDATQGQDTAIITAATEPGFSPQSGNVGSETDFAVNIGLVQRLAWDLNTLLESRRGAFDVYLRGRQTDASGVIDVQLKGGVSGGGDVQEGPIITWPQDTATFAIKLARFTVPENVTIGSVDLKLFIALEGGVGNFRSDYLVLVPVDSAAAIMTTPAVLSNFVTDPEEGIAFTTDVNGNVGVFVDVAGPVPFFIPPRLSVIFRHVRGIDFSSRILTAQSPIRHTFSPRYYQ